MRIRLSGSTPHTYMLDGESLSTVSHEKDVGVLVDHQLKFHQYAASVVAKANRVLGLISKSFKYLDTDSLPILYKALVLPIIEYANSVLGPFYIGDQKIIEKVQKHAMYSINTFFSQTWFCQVI